MTMSRQRNERDDHMDEMARRVSGVLDGEDLFDVACICARIAAFSLKEGMPPEGREGALLRIIADMHQVTFGDSDRTNDKPAGI